MTAFSRIGNDLPTTKVTAERPNTLGAALSITPKLMRSHTHTAVTIRAIGQRNGIPYEVERKVCADCRRLLEERPVKRAAAA